MGDQTNAHDISLITLNGGSNLVPGNLLATGGFQIQPGQFLTVTFFVDVTAANSPFGATPAIALRISGTGGVDPAFVLNAVDVRQTSPGSPNVPGEALSQRH